MISMIALEIHSEHYTMTKLTNYRLKAEYRFVGETTVGAPTWGYRDSGVQYHRQAPN